MTSTEASADYESPPRLEGPPRRQPRKELGHIQVIFGPMFSGKTSELLRRVRRYQIRKDECLLLKTLDKRYSNDLNKVITHDKVNYLEALGCERLYDMYDHAMLADIIGIDEGQFFPDIIEFAEEMANNGKVVIIASLDSDYKRDPFGNICSLVAKAESVTKLSSICISCKGEACFTARVTPETDVKVIGGRNKYKPVCRSCYIGLQPE